MGIIRDQVAAYAAIEELQKAKVEKQSSIADLSTETTTELKNKVNAILAALRAAGIIESE